MVHSFWRLLPSLLGLLLFAAALRAEDPLHKRVDALILAGAKGKPVSARADDAEFLRRVTLDLAGRIPTLQEVRSFLQDQSQGGGGGDNPPPPPPASGPEPLIASWPVPSIHGV